MSKLALNKYKKLIQTSTRRNLRYKQTIIKIYILVKIT